VRRHRIPGGYVRTLTPAQYRALGAVIELCQEPDGTVFVSQRTLARALGMAASSYPAAGRLLGALVEAGALRLIEPGQVGPNGHRKAAVFRLSWVVLWAVDNSALRTRLRTRDSTSQRTRDGNTKNPLRGSIETPRRDTPAVACVFCAGTGVFRHRDGDDPCPNHCRRSETG